MLYELLCCHSFDMYLGNGMYLKSFLPSSLFRWKVIFQNISETLITPLLTTLYNYGKPVHFHNSDKHLRVVAERTALSGKVRQQKMIGEREGG